MTFSPEKVRRQAIAGLVGLGIVLVTCGSAIPVKALLAQALLEGAWLRAAAAEPAPRPWPGATTWPVARLVAPDFGEGGEDLIVVAGSSGESLAFGPGHVEGTAPPDAAVGNVALAGHRDTHFRFLAELERGDELVLETPRGVRRLYRVASADVVHERTRWPVEPTSEPTLTLVTCWPFDALVPGGPWRYVVRAVGEG